MRRGIHAVQRRQTHMLLVHAQPWTTAQTLCARQAAEMFLWWCRQWQADGAHVVQGPQRPRLCGGLRPHARAAGQRGPRQQRHPVGRQRQADRQVSCLHGRHAGPQCAALLGSHHDQGLDDGQLRPLCVMACSYAQQVFWQVGCLLGTVPFGWQMKLSSMRYRHSSVSLSSHPSTCAAPLLGTVRPSWQLLL